VPRFRLLSLSKSKTKVQHNPDGSGLERLTMTSAGVQASSGYRLRR
jgi:hypothetical protein